MRTSIRKLAIPLTFMMATLPGQAAAKDGDIEARGPIAAISSSSVSVGDLTCAINSGTEFEGKQGENVSLSQFNVGDIVKLKCRGSSAHSLEMEDAQGEHENENENESEQEHSGNSAREIKCGGSLSEITGNDTAAVGKVEYRNKLKRKHEDDRLKITVKVPVISAVPLSTDLNTAKSLQLTATLLRDGTAYAICTLKFDHRSAIKGVAAAEYKAEVREKLNRSIARSKQVKGSCDTDLATDGVQRGLPAVRKGDTVVITDSVAGEFLEGTV